MTDLWHALADILVNYSTKTRKGDRVLITMVETDTFPLARAVYAAAVKAGAFPYIEFSSAYLERDLMRYGDMEQLDWVTEPQAHGMEWADVYIGVDVGRVRDVTAPLAEAFAGIHNRAYAGSAAAVPMTAAEMAEVLVPALVLVAERRGVPLGFCQIEPAGAAAWIESIAVEPREQGRGIGTLLMQHALAEAARRAGPRVRLAVSDRNAAAYALYRRLGFTVTAKSARYRAERAMVLAALEGAVR